MSSTRMALGALSALLLVASMTSNGSHVVTVESAFSM